MQIWRLNRALIPNPHRLRAGIVLQIPAPASTVIATAGTPPARTIPARTIVVRQGDTLTSIAAQTLGDARQWRALYSANRDRIHHPNLLIIGTVLRLPGPGPHGTTLPPERLPPERSASAPSSATEVRGEAAPSPTPTATDRREDAHMAPDGPKAIGGSAIEQQMARIYNEKGRFVYEQSRALGFEPAVGAACLSVESNGAGYAGKRMIIRFESHIFRRLTGRRVPVRHTGAQEEEYKALHAALKIDENAAYESISMGAAQIMGFNAQRIGYANAREMYEAFDASLKAQLAGFFSFVRTSRVLLNAARSRQWGTFAYHYNGSGYAANAYDKKMAHAYTAYKKVTAGLDYA